MSSRHGRQVNGFAILVVMVAAIPLIVPETVFDTDDDPEQFQYFD